MVSEVTRGIISSQCHRWETLINGNLLIIVLKRASATYDTVSLLLQTVIYRVSTFPLQVIPCGTNAALAIWLLLAVWLLSKAKNATVRIPI